MLSQGKACAPVRTVVFFPGPSVMSGELVEKKLVIIEGESLYYCNDWFACQQEKGFWDVHE